VGIAAIEMANVEGAISIATTRTPKKKPTLVEVGAKHVIVTEEEDLVARINQITGDKGASIVLTPSLAKESSSSRKPPPFIGMIYEYGALAAEPTPFPLFTALAKGLSVRGYTLREVFADPKLKAKAEKNVFDHVEKATSNRGSTASFRFRRSWKRIATWSQTRSWYPFSNFR
jgi:NADPH:quinone reductase-like Zn-dependent oxidoreductase